MSLIISWKVLWIRQLLLEVSTGKRPETEERGKLKAQVYLLFLTMQFSLRSRRLERRLASRQPKDICERTLDKAFDELRPIPNRGTITGDARLSASRKPLTENAMVRYAKSISDVQVTNPGGTSGEKGASVGNHGINNVRMQ